MKATTLESERLYLEPLSTAHLSQKYVEWMNDEEIIRYLESGGDYNIDKLSAFLKEQENKDILFWAIHLKDSGKHIGNIKIDPVDEVEGSGEYGILMGDKSEWGKGYAMEASNLVISHCFEDLGLKQITLGVIRDNVAALQLYSKMGFEVIEVKSAVGPYAGKMCDSIRMRRQNDK